MRLFTKKFGTPCIDKSSKDLSQQSVCPLSGGSAQRAKGVRKVAFTKPSRATSECNERETDNYARMNILANWRRWRLEGSEQRVKGVKPYPFIASYLKRGAVAFTLAEVLITLAIIGVVAAITIPGLVTKINDKVKNTRITTIEKKLYQGTDKLMILGHINGYDTTEEFVQALSEHMKISTYCSADRIVECFPYDKINVDGDSGTVNVADLKTPEAFGLKSDEYSDPVSFITGDGTPYIISYKKDCDIDDGNGRANSAACIAGIYDWNGARVPNKFATETKAGTTDEKVATGDIMFLGNVTKLAGKKVVQTDGDLNPSITSNGKTYTKFKLVDGGGLNYCGDDGNQDCASANGLNTCTGSEYASYDDHGNHQYCSNNKWAAAKKKCKDLGLELPDKTALKQLYCQARGGSYNNNYIDCSGSTVNTALNEKLTAENAINHTFYSSSPYNSYYAYLVYFNNGGTGANSVNSSYSVVCLGE